MTNGRIDPEADPQKLKEFFSEANAEHAEAAEEIKREMRKRVLQQIIEERSRMTWDGKPLEDPDSEEEQIRKAAREKALKERKNWEPGKAEG